MSRQIAFLGAWVILGAAVASADVVVLKNGGKLEGIVQDKGDRVRVEMEFGGMELPRDLVHDIIKGPTPLADYRARAAALREDDVAGHYQLGLWALGKGLTQSARDEFEKVVILDPEHEAARKQLGFEKIDGRWLTQDEAMRAKGFVRMEGQWVTKEEFELRQALAQEQRLREEARAAEERERRRQEQLARLEAIADARLAALEEENARLRADRYERYYAPSYGAYGGYGYGGFYGYGYPYYGLRTLGTTTYVNPLGQCIQTNPLTGQTAIVPSQFCNGLYSNCFTR